MVDFQVPTPGGASYVAPNVSFDWIGKLLDNYTQGMQQAKAQQSMNAFPQGVPIDPRTGQPDINAIANTAARIGGLPAVQQYLPFLYGAQQNQQLANVLTGGGQPQAPPAPAPNNAASPQTLTPAPVSRGTQAAPAAPSAPFMGGQPVAQGDQAPDNLRSIVTESFGPDRDMSRFIPGFARMMNVDADQPLSDNQARDVRFRLGQYKIARGEGQPMVGGNRPQVGVSEDVSQPTQATSAAEQNVNAPLARQAQAAAQAAENSPEVQRLRQEAKRNLTAGIYASDTRTGGSPEKGKIFTDNAHELNARADRMVDAAVKAGEFTGEQKRNLRPETAIDYERAKTIAEEEAKASLKEYTGIQARAQNYEGSMKRYLGVIKGILNSPGVYTGIGAEAALDFNKIKAIFGDTRAAALQEAMKKGTSQSVLDQITQQREEMSGSGLTAVRIFAQQLQLMMNASPSLETTLVGNRILAEIADRMGKYSSDVAQMARDWRRDPKNKDVLGTGFDQMLSDYAKKNPVFTQIELSHPEILGAPTIPGTVVASNSPMQILNWTRAMGLNKGDPFRTADGRIKAAP